MSTLDILKRTLEPLGEMIKKNLITEFNNQGHKLTGNFEKSIKFDIEIIGNEIYMTFTYNKYGAILNKGTRKNRIPYSGKRSKGGVKISKYIQALIAYAKRRGMRNPRNAAFAIAAKQKREGMPTRGSYKFSKNKRRKFFQDVALGNASNEIEQKSQDIFVNAISKTLDLVLAEYLIAA